MTDTGLAKWATIGTLPNIPVRDLTAQQFFQLVKQAVLEGTLEANSKTQSNKADFVRSQLLGG